MTPTSLENLTKDQIRELYLESLVSSPEKLTHIGLNPNGGTPPPVPSVHQIETDVAMWYGGILTAARCVAPNSHLPTVKEVVTFIAQNTQQVKEAIAA